MCVYFCAASVKVQKTHNSQQKKASKKKHFHAIFSNRNVYVCVRIKNIYICVHKIMRGRIVTYTHTHIHTQIEIFVSRK